MMRIATIALAILFLRCAPTPNGSTPPIGEIEFRVVTGEDDPSGSAFDYEEGNVFLGPRHTFQLSHVYSAQDGFGLPALGFKITESQSDEFEKWTGSIVGSPLAIIVNGEIVTMPVVEEALPGKGVIAGGAAGFTAEDVESLIAEITAGED